MERITSVVLCAVLLAGVSVLGKIAPQNMPQDEKLERRIVATDSRINTIAGVTSNLLSTTDVPGGLVVLQNCGEQKTYTFGDTASLTLRDALNSLVAIDPTYNWVIKDGVVNIMPVDTMPKLLDLQIAHFNVNDATSVDEALNQLLSMPQVRKRIAELNLSSGLIRIGLANLNSSEDLADNGLRKINVRSENTTVREALNAIVRVHGRAVWVYTEQNCGSKKEFTISFLVR